VLGNIISLGSQEIPNSEEETFEMLMMAFSASVLSVFVIILEKFEDDISREEEF